METISTRMLHHYVPLPTPQTKCFTFAPKHLLFLLFFFISGEGTTYDDSNSQASKPWAHPRFLSFLHLPFHRWLSSGCSASWLAFKSAPELPTPLCCHCHSSAQNSRRVALLLVVLNLNWPIIQEPYIISERTHSSGQGSIPLVSVWTTNHIHSCFRACVCFCAHLLSPRIYTSSYLWGPLTRSASSSKLSLTYLAYMHYPLCLLPPPWYFSKYSDDIKEKILKESGNLGASPGLAFDSICDIGHWAVTPLLWVLVFS